MRFDHIVLDEVGYVPLADIGAEFLVQVIAERAERATLVITPNMPFSEWPQPNPGRSGDPNAVGYWPDAAVAPSLWPNTRALRGPSDILRMLERVAISVAPVMNHRKQR